MQPVHNQKDRALPDGVLAAIFIQAQRDKAPIPVRGFINGAPFVQNLVKLKGIRRLYINTSMLKNSPKRIGKMAAIEIEFSPVEQITAHHPKFVAALELNKKNDKVHHIS